MKKIKNLKTFHEIFLFVYYIVLFGNQYVGSAYLRHIRLLYSPTAEMQKDKTVMIGGSMIDHNIYRDAYWNAHDEYNPYTYNYYLNITLFPWLEIAYTCTLVKGIHGSNYWPQQTWGKFTNQDRSFHGRFASVERRLVAAMDTTNRAGSE